MPSITASGTYNKDSVGFSKLGATSRKRAIMIAGTLGTSLTINYIDDGGTSRQLDTVTLPYAKEFTLNADIELVSVGSPSLNVMISDS